MANTTKSGNRQEGQGRNQGGQRQEGMGRNQDDKQRQQAPQAVEREEARLGVGSGRCGHGSALSVRCVSRKHENGRGPGSAHRRAAAPAPPQLHAPIRKPKSYQRPEFGKE